MNPEDIMLNEVESTQERQVLCELTYMWNLIKMNSWKQRIDRWLQEVWGRGGGDE